MRACERTAQRGIGSGFGARSTADDVLAGIDLAGKLAVVTGGYSGLGLESTRALVRAGAEVVVPARSPSAARRAAEGLSGIELAELDLADLGSVRRFAEGFLASGRSVDILINNAGIMAMPETRVGPGWESQFAVNHLGHYALTNLLWPALADGGARVVSVSSSGHQFSPIRWDDVQLQGDYDKFLAYAQSKTANSLFAVHLDALGKANGVRAFTLHPGEIPTSLIRHMPQEEMAALGWVDADGNPTGGVFDWKTPEQGAATQVWAATSPQLDGLGGVYCQDCDIVAIASDEGVFTSGVREHAVDPDQAERLWRLSSELTGVEAFRSNGKER